MSTRGDSTGKKNGLYHKGGRKAVSIEKPTETIILRAEYREQVKLHSEALAEECSVWVFLRQCMHCRASQPPRQEQKKKKKGRFHVFRHPACLHSLGMPMPEPGDKPRKPKSWAAVIGFFSRWLGLARWAGNTVDYGRVGTKMERFPIERSHWLLPCG